MKIQPIKYQKKIVAFVDILGFSEMVNQSAADNDASSIARMIGRLRTDNDIALYQKAGAEICPDANCIDEDLCMRITQVSDCVIVSAEVSPAGAINIINYCRKIAERLLLREHVLCRGYVTVGKVYHEDTMIFGPAYQEAVKGEKTAAAIKFADGNIGSPFIEVDANASSYLTNCADDCIRQMLPRITAQQGKHLLISPYGVFSRLAQWAFSPNKTPDNMRSEINSAKNILDVIRSSISNAEPSDERAREKIRISLEKIAEADADLTNAIRMVDELGSPFPGRFQGRSATMEA